MLKFVRGTLAQYNANKALYTDAIYFATDTEQIMMNEVSYSVPKTDKQANANLVQSITGQLAGKQDTLTPGTGIAINGNEISCTLDTAIFEVVSSLPTSNINANKIYVVPLASDKQIDGNKYAEYIRANNQWEKLGEFVSENFDLSNYATTSAMETALGNIQSDLTNNYLTKTDAGNTYLSKTNASSTYLTVTGASAYLKKTEAADLYLDRTVAGGAITSLTNDVTNLNAALTWVEAGAE